MQIHKSESRGAGSPDVWGVYEKATGSVQYVCACPETREAALIDVVQDFDPAAARRSFDSAKTVLDLVERERLKVVQVLDTHPHADHLMASFWLAERTGAPNAIGEKVTGIADLWADFYGFRINPTRHFSALLAEGDTLSIGDLTARVWLSPGHTLGSVTYVIGDAAFVHDTLMQPDSGTARADFPGGDAGTLFDSIQRILELPDDTRLFIGHDYPGDDRDEPDWEASVQQHRTGNINLKDNDRAGFITQRNERDATLALPDRMLAALQFNLRAGRPPEPDGDGHRRITLPLDRF